MFEAASFSAEVLSSRDWGDCLRKIEKYREKSTLHSVSQRIMAEVWGSQSSHLDSILEEGNKGADPSLCVRLAKKTIQLHASLLKRSVDILSDVVGK